MLEKELSVFMTPELPELCPSWWEPNLVADPSHIAGHQQAAPLFGA